MKQHIIIAAFLAFSGKLAAQERPALTDLSFWKPTQAKNWQIAGTVSADLRKNETMKAGSGTGVLVNLPDDKNRANLLSVAEYGDVEVSFDFMMAKHSNSGFYLQGRYEVQLLDNWGHQQPTYGDCGGVYARRRWNPEEQMFDGHPPRLNACLAPGLWQHFDISFQAPRFDASGKKIANARLLRVVLNGYVVQENIELTGPTGGPISGAGGGERSVYDTGRSRSGGVQEFCHHRQGRRAGEGRSVQLQGNLRRLPLPGRFCG
jgi:hypothetical protein